MPNSFIAKLAIFLFVVLGIALLAVVTQEKDDDPCADGQTDITGAVLADGEGEQSALANRAILQRGRCAPQGKGDAVDIDALDEAAAPNAGPERATPGTDTREVPHKPTPPVPPPAALAPLDAHAVLEQRCMVCHGCYDAPCQLKLEAQAGIDRGASKDLVYNGTRLVQANLTRLFDDAQSADAWREKGFYPVLNRESPRAGVMFRMLQLKQAHPLPADGPMPAGFDFSLSRDQQCPSEEEFDGFSSSYPLWGMPYGLPGLNTDEHTLLSDWLLAGAPAAPESPLSEEETALLNRWETFLNAEDNKHQLAARYLYEHLFLASLYLQEGDQFNWFRLVRSSSPPGQAIQLIATRRPYDDPQHNPFYYRLQRMPVTPLAKVHMPYRFDADRLARYQSLFIDADYQVSSLPGYAPAIASNPFIAFRQIPVLSRYRFLLDEAQFSIMNFIKGPVCRGQIALNVIDDHFWVMFIAPDSLDVSNGAEFLARETDNLKLPDPQTGTVIDLIHWGSYARANRKYQQARTEFIARETKDHGLRLHHIWDGSGSNDNAALTVFRHFDTASVVRGFVGEIPKTAWVIDYSLLERIHYLLVAGFDIYGSAAHQLQSRLYMDFLRMEGESNFLLFLPREDRAPLLDYWYRDARKGVREYMGSRSLPTQETSNISYASSDSKAEFLLKQRQRIHAASAPQWDLLRTAGIQPQTVDALQTLVAARGAHNSFLPDNSILNVVDRGSDAYYTLLRNVGHSNIAQPFNEDKRRRPEEDYLTVVPGFIGAYPNQFFQVNAADVPVFAEAVKKLRSRRDYARLQARFGVARNAPWFWRFSDKLHARARAQDPVAYGLFDYNRYHGD